jgi:hypothetical protein
MVVPVLAGERIERRAAGRGEGRPRVRVPAEELIRQARLAVLP